jgi:hypothetical protein
MVVIPTKIVDGAKTKHPMQMIFAVTEKGR